MWGWSRQARMTLEVGMAMLALALVGALGFWPLAYA